MRKLLIATGNPKKAAELDRILTRHGVLIVTPAEVGGLPEVEEDQETFAGNAAKKALSAARHSGLWCLADDSGLEVEALGGDPGVRSARFAGEHATDLENNARLLAELSGFPPERRGARFVCALALASPEGSLAAELAGTVRGRILDAPRGTAGFGYDPLFLFDEPDLPGSGQTFAELGPDAKSEVSHRGRALARLAAELGTLIQHAG